MPLNKLNLHYAELVRVRGTNSALDGRVVRVVGVSVRHIIDIYILEFIEDEIHLMPDGSMQYSAFTMPEVCLERT